MMGRSRRVKLTAAFAVGTLLLTAWVVLAPGAGASNVNIKQYRVAVSPTSVGAGSTATYTFTIRNVQASPQSLGSANLTAATSPTTGAGFSLLKPSPGSFPQALARPLLDGTTAVGSATLLSRTAIAIRGLSLQPGHFVTVGFRAEAPCRASTDSAWGTLVKQSNDFNGPPGNNFNLLGGPATTAVTGACHLDVSAEPMSTGVAETITDDLFSTGGPVTVAVMSQTTASTPVSALVTFSAAPLAVSAEDSGGGPLTLDGTSPVAATGGVASFGDLSIPVSGEADVLHAAPVDAAGSGIDPAGVDSGPFSVTDAFSDCSKKCTVPDDNGTTEVVITSTATSGFLAVSLGVEFTDLTVCPGSTYVLPPSDGVTFNLYQGSGTKTIQYTILHPDRPGSQFQVCFASTAPFATPSGPAGFDAASGHYIGLLPACKTAPAPCYQGYDQDSHTKAVTLTALAPTEGDPWTH